MKHLCTCGHELAPADRVAPINAVSHGICAPCAIRMAGYRSAFWYPVKIAGFAVELLIQPGRQAPHVSYDNPRKWDPARAPRVIEQRVSHDGVQLDPAEFRRVVALACERANVPGGRPSVRPAFSRQLPLRFGGHLQRAMERTGFQRETSKENAG